MDRDNHETCITPIRELFWPGNRPAGRVIAVYAESLGLTFGEPPVLGGPYARFDLRCLSEYLDMYARCDTPNASQTSSEVTAWELASCSTSNLEEHCYGC